MDKAITEATTTRVMPEPHGIAPEREGALDRTASADLNAPWSLRFDRDGTEDVAVILDASGDELVRSRHFWLPERGDPIPATLAAMRLIHAAPKVLAALEAVLPYAENECRSLDECWRRDGEAAAEKAVDACAAAVERAQVALAEAKTAGLSSTPTEPDIQAILARRRQIAHIWSIADVQHRRAATSPRPG